jgi:SAM-dependent methyltransferase
VSDHLDHEAEDQPDDNEQDPVAFWQRRYGESERIWSGAPNAALVACLSGVVPGRALDLGCGEGGDSVWLASQGWLVTGVDISTTAMERARAHVQESGLDPASFTGVIADLAEWEPEGDYDLVSACFLHSPVDFPRANVLQRAAAAVRPGGHVLIVGHADPPPWSEHHHEDHVLLGPEEELASLGLNESQWETVVLETRTRDAIGPDGQRATLRDAVTFVRRRD